MFTCHFVVTCIVFLHHSYSWPKPTGTAAHDLIISAPGKMASEGGSEVRARTTTPVSMVHSEGHHSSFTKEPHEEGKTPTIFHDAALWIENENRIFLITLLSKINFKIFDIELNICCIVNHHNLSIWMKCSDPCDLCAKAIDEINRECNNKKM